MWHIMEFCSKCGSYLQRTNYGFLCPRCGNRVRASTKTPYVPIAEAGKSNPIYVDEGLQDDEIVHQTCPKCGHVEASRRVTGILGEHAGVTSERTLEQFKCMKCGHRWARSK